MDAATETQATRFSYRDFRFPEVFAAAAIGIGICHFDGRILEANPALERILGYNPEELVGLDPWKLYDAEFQGPAQDGCSHLAELMRGERDSFTVDKRHRRKDGSEFWGHLTVSLARRANGEPAFLVALLENATERKQVEENLRQAEKMEVIGRLAGGVAHDFNNLLTGILLYCDLILAELEPENPLRHHVEEVRMAGEQGAALTHQLLAIARKQTPEPQALPINETVSSTENLLRRLIGEQIELITALEPSAGMVFADPGQLRQILMNLVLNARDALGQGTNRQRGKIRISTRPTEFPGNAGLGSVQRAAALIVEDNGCGMNAEVRARLFEPFFTTKKMGEGTGMGLSTVQQFVRESGGRIEVTTAPGCGTRIAVLLPAVEQEKQTGSSDSRPIVDGCPHETILLVDGHSTARDSMQEVLLREGYQVLAAGCGEEAIGILADQSATIHLLISECTMPGMSGWELAERSREANPKLRVLLVSSHPTQEEGRAEPSPVMSKPFSGSVLTRRVRDVLDDHDRQAEVSMESRHGNGIYCACAQFCSAVAGSEFSQPADPR